MPESKSFQEAKTKEQRLIAEGKIKKVTLDVSFVRADCAAFGGDIVADDYCNEKGIYWLKRCYEEYYCGIEPTHFQI